MAETTQQWEYRVQTVGSALTGSRDEQVEEVLNEWGLEGWEAVNVYAPSQSPKVTIVAKRSLAAAASRRFSSLP